MDGGDGMDGIYGMGNVCIPLGVLGGVMGAGGVACYG